MISVVVLSKDEPELADTLDFLRAQVRSVAEEVEVLVVDASAKRLDWIRERNLGVRWLDFTPPRNVRVSIPHQRNASLLASCGDVIVFVDAGGRPSEGWLRELTAPILTGEELVTVGPARGQREGLGLFDGAVGGEKYILSAGTGNLAFHRDAAVRIGGFDESFEYGSDVDFTWRLCDAGCRIAVVSAAVVEYPAWGTFSGGAWRAQVRRSYRYGKARARLYRKHRGRLRRIARDDPVVVAYPLFLLGLPLSAVFPLYPALLLVPLFRNRGRGALACVGSNLIYGVGVLREAVAR